MSRRNWTKPVEKKPVEKPASVAEEEEIQTEVAKSVERIKATQTEAPERPTPQKSPAATEQEKDPFDGIFRIFNSESSGKEKEEVQELPGMAPVQKWAVPMDEEMEDLMGFLDAVQPVSPTEVEVKISELESENKELRLALGKERSNNEALRAAAVKAREIIANSRELQAKLDAATREYQVMKADNEKLRKENTSLLQQLREATDSNHAIEMFSPALLQVFANMNERLRALETAFADKERES